MCRPGSARPNTVQLCHCTHGDIQGIPDGLPPMSGTKRKQTRALSPSANKTLFAPLTCQEAPIGNSHPLLSVGHRDCWTLKAHNLFKQEWVGIQAPQPY